MLPKLKTERAEINQAAEKMDWFHRGRAPPGDQRHIAPGAALTLDLRATAG